MSHLTKFLEGNGGWGGGGGGKGGSSGVFRKLYGTAATE